MDQKNLSWKLKMKKARSKFRKKQRLPNAEKRVIYLETHQKQIIMIITILGKLTIEGIETGNR